MKDNLQSDPFERYASRIEDALPDDWPEAHIKLIDALRGYIRTVDGHVAELSDDLTKAEHDRWRAERGALKNILTQLEQYEMDPTLDGLIPWERCL